ncbi:hypothetical protein [Variovorax sp. GT1P44]|uniref:hypothetical protein n=1 Tax=Variovorax sp. GT1P44 TaxID=3443742 RepID=UPI003F474EA1
MSIGTTTPAFSGSRTAMAVDGVTASLDASNACTVPRSLVLSTAMFGAAGLVAVPELLPIAVRSTGLSLVYAIGTSVFGGTTQFVVTWLIAVTHDPMAPAYYVVAMCALSVAAMWMLPESRDVDVMK